MSRLHTLPVAAFDREPVDALAWRTLGDRAGLVELIHSANPGLAALGPFLPEGTVVEVPLPAAAESAAPVAPLVQLWN